MDMNRRAFLAALAAAGPAALLDPERLLWEPGKRVTFDLWRPIDEVLVAHDSVTGLSVRLIRQWTRFHPEIELKVLASLPPWQVVRRTSSA